MEKIILDSKELQKELGMTGYDIYQYVRRGLPHAHGNQTLYDLNEVSEWIDGFGERERKREEIKKQIMDQLSEEEAKIVTQPKWNAQYAVVWGTTSRRRELTILRALYLMVLNSTSNGRSMIYLSKTDKAADEIDKVVKRRAGKQAKGFKSLTFKGLAKSILKDKGNHWLNTSNEIIIKEAIKVLENDAEFLEGSSLKYRQFFVEKLEETTADERRLIQLLSKNYGEFMMNVEEKALKQSKELIEWLERIEEIKTLEIE